ncbi:thioredoxin family protein [Anaerobacillus sp. MEB173]|uniref:thioredoxin family protein n=1 Tax=Anaerobacillus sp. MEB173 TaxID=3383345 RepID=UPI003F8DB49D
MSEYTMIVELEREEELQKLMNNNKEPVVIYFYTPLCGTCKVASKMLTVIESLLPQLQISFCNANRMPNIVQEMKVMSVPYLGIIKNDTVCEEVYAFSSVENVYHILKKYTE